MKLRSDWRHDDADGAFPTVYGCYLFFQLFSHKELYVDKNPENFKSKKFLHGPREQKERFKNHMRRSKAKAHKERKEEGDLELGATSTETNGSTFDTNGDANGHAEPKVVHELEEDVQEPEMNWKTALGSLIVIAVVS